MRTGTSNGMIPDPAPWFIVRDGKAIAETFDRHTAEQCAEYGYQVFTAAQWLGKLNKEAKR